MSDISAAGGTSATTTQVPQATLPPGYTPPSTSGNSNTTGGLTGINSSTFLQLLVAQLQYQNPTSPVDSTQFLSQTAAFEEVQQLDTLQSSLASLVSSQQASAATSMLGAQVQGTDASGNPVTGIVSGVQLTSQGPVLTVGNSTVPFSSVTTVTSPSASVPSATNPTSSSSASGSSSGSTTSDSSSSAGTTTNGPVTTTPSGSQGQASPVL